MARYEGDGSYERLVFDNYAKEKIEEGVSKSSAQNGLRHIPLSFNYTGHYNYSSGNLSSRDSVSRYRQSKIASTNISPTLAISSTMLSTSYRNNKGYGFSLRYVAKLTTDSICPKGWEMARRRDDKSYDNIIAQIYSIKTSIYANGAYQPSSGILRLDTPILIIPMSFLRASIYAYMHRRETIENYWSSSVNYGSSSSSFLNAGSNTMSTQSSYARGNGTPLRCVAKSML